MPTYKELREQLEELNSQLMHERARAIAHIHELMETWGLVTADLENRARRTSTQNEQDTGPDEAAWYIAREQAIKTIHDMMAASDLELKDLGPDSTHR